MKIKIKPEILIVLIILIPVLIWVNLAKDFIIKHTIKGHTGNVEDLCEAIFIFIITFILYFSIKSLRKKLEQSEKEYKRLFELNSTPMWITDKQTLHFILVNDAAVATYGYSREEFLTMTIKDIRPKEEVFRLEAHIGNDWQGFNNLGLWKHKKKNGDIIIIEVKAENITLNKKECRLVSAHNVTDLLNARDEIRKGVKKEEALEEIMQTAEQLANFGSWEFDLYTHKVKCSNGIFRLYGYEPNSVEVTFDLCLTHIHPDDLKIVKERYSQVVDKIFIVAHKIDSSSYFNFRIIDKNGHLKYIQSGLRIVRNDQQEPILLRGFNLDITETKLSVEKLKQSHNELQALAAHLENIREEERADIARKIHDELGQQLTAIKFDISWVKTKLQQDATPVREKISEAINMVDETIKSVRKIASKLRPIVLAELGLSAALKWQSKEFEKRTGIPCHFAENFGNNEINKCVAIAFFRIYQESLTNITRHASATRVDSSLFLDNDIITLQIRDNGIGFDPEEIKSKKSLGLVGLKERTLSMNAELTLQSIKGKGTTITINRLYDQACKMKEVEL